MKAIATIMNRHYLGENAYIYSFDNCLVGDYNEETNTFMDRNGNEYLSITDIDLLYSEVPQGFTNCIDFNDVKELFPEEDISVNEAISLYNDHCREISYIVGIGSGGTIFTMPLNVSEIMEGIESISEDDYESMSDEEYLENMENGIIPDQYIDLINDVINGKYDLEELKLLKKSLLYGKDNLDSVLDTVDLQIEADTLGVGLADLVPEAIEEEEELEEEEEELVDNRSEYEKRGLMDIDKLFNQITKTLVAQDEPTRRMLVELARMDLANHKKNGILLTGESGVGKTLLMSLIAKYSNRPFLVIDSTQLTIPGYVGKSIEQYLWELYVDCGKDKEKAESAIVFFDEIDKKGSSKKDDISGKGVLNVLLKFLDGTVYEACENSQHKTAGTYTQIDTSNMKVVLGGAFTDVYKNMKRDTKIGFTQGLNAKKEDKTPTMEDFVTKAMMSDEFMGRVPILIKMNDLKEEDIKRILIESDDSALKHEERSFDEIGVKLSVTPEYLDRIAKKAHDRKTGARGINAMVTNTTWRPFDVVYRNLGEYEEVILNGETVEDNKNFQLVKKKKEL